MLSKRHLVVIATLSVLLAMGTAPIALASVSSDLQALVSLNPGAETAAMEASVRNYAKGKNITYEAALTLVLKEAQVSVAQASPAQPRMSSAPSGTEAEPILGNAIRKGDIFYSPAKSSAVIRHGHSGIYYTVSTIVEAPGVNQLSRSTSASTLRVAAGSKKQYVKVVQSLRNASANYAYNNLRFREYNANFAFNRRVDGSLNCSQLVWAAYIRGANLDIDGNGGAGVYPWDIRDSSNVSTYQNL